MFNEDYEEDLKGSKVTAASALASFNKSIADFEAKSVAVDSAVTAGPVADAAGSGEKTIREMLDARETELKELEQLQEIQNTDYMEALASDISQKP